MWWDGETECRINGQLAHHNQVFTQGQQDGFHAAGGARRTMGVVVRRDDFIRTLAALRGVGPEDVLLKRATMELTPEAAMRFRTGISRVIKPAIRRKALGLAADTDPDPAEATFGLLVDAYLQSPPVLHREDRPRHPELIVRKAEERFYSSKRYKVSLADLCATTGVSQSTLYRAFDAVCGQPPLAYFHKR